MDVTTQYNNRRALMGSSYSSNPDYFASNRSLDFAKSSNSIANAATTHVTAIPQTIGFKDKVGLFGAENVFIKVDLNIQDIKDDFADADLVVNDYLPLKLTEGGDDDAAYDMAVIDFDKDLSTVNKYDPARFVQSIETLEYPMISVDVNNLKTGNKYIDSWFDVRIYTKDRKEWPYEKMYVDINSHFYLGFHARNTKRLPYNVSMTVGEIYINRPEIPESERRYIFA